MHGERKQVDTFSPGVAEQETYIKFLLGFVPSFSYTFSVRPWPLSAGFLSEAPGGLLWYRRAMTTARDVFSREDTGRRDAPRSIFMESCGADMVNVWEVPMVVKMFVRWVSRQDLCGFKVQLRLFEDFSKNSERREGSIASISVYMFVQAQEVMTS